MAKSSSTQRIELNKNQIVLIAVVSVLIILAYIAYNFLPQPIYKVDYNGNLLTFRADLREANKVPVYPNRVVLYYELRGGLAQNITIVFLPVEGENGIYSAEGFEITYKLGLLFKLIGKNVVFDSRNVSSYKYLPGKIQNPIIAIVPPRFANETAVRLDGHVVTISGLPDNDVNNPYKNLDLATIKFLMVMLDIDQDFSQRVG